jgi:hypothetical protein
MRNIEIRLRKLEAKLNPPEKPVVIGLAVVANALPRERKKNLAPGERVVIDWYRNVNGVSWGRERISTDPADEGRHCRRGGCLFDVIQELHQACSYRVQAGSCSTCGGTPVAECSPQESDAVPEDRLSSQELDP